MNKSFETAMNELEDIVRQLEDGNTSLSKSIALYEKGVKLSEYCTHILDNAKQKIEIINNGFSEDEASKSASYREDNNEF